MTDLFGAEESHLAACVGCAGCVRVAVLHQQLHQPLLQPQHRPYAAHNNTALVNEMLQL